MATTTTRRLSKEEKVKLARLVLEEGYYNLIEFWDQFAFDLPAYEVCEPTLASWHKTILSHAEQVLDCERESDWIPRR